MKSRVNPNRGKPAGRQAVGSLDRRTFLRGMLGGAAVTLALPAFEIFMNAHGTGFASGDPFPKRFGLFFWGNGVIPTKWVPTGTGFGNDWTLSEQLLPLAQVKDLITVVRGMEVKTANVDPHNAGAAGILSGSPLAAQGAHRTFTSPTIDQVIANGLSGATRFRSLEFGAQAGGGLSYNGPDNLNPAEDSPLAFFDRIFGGGFSLHGDGGQTDPKLVRRRSILDSVMVDAEALQKRLGASDRQRLDQHLTGVRDLERRASFLTENPPTLASCAVPAQPLASYPDIDGHAQVSVKNRVMIDVLAMALACDQTRVFSNFITAPVNNVLFPNTNGGHHQLTHDEPGDQPQVNSIVKLIMAEFAYLVSALQAVPEGEGTLLDNTIVFATTDCSSGKTHSLNEFPILLAGSAGGMLKQGYHHRSLTNENASKVHMTLMEALGVTATSFGMEEGIATTTLPGLIA